MFECVFDSIDGILSCHKKSIKFNLLTHLLGFFFFFLPHSLGTHFDGVAIGSLINVTVQGGRTAFLNCKINLLQDKTVKWILMYNEKFFRWEGGHSDGNLLGLDFNQKFTRNS